MNEITYYAVETALAENDTLMSPAEAHGTLTGMLCADADIFYDQWLGEVFDDEDEGTLSTASGFEILQQLFWQTQDRMAEENFEFDLLLPDELLPLADRATAFAEWCRGFLYGVGALPSSEKLSEECNEMLRDIFELSRLDADVDGDDDETAFMELTEYVRVGVLLIHFEVGSVTSKQETFH